MIVISQPTLNSQIYNVSCDIWELWPGRLFIFLNNFFFLIFLESLDKDATAGSPVKQGSSLGGSTSSTS